MFQILRGGCNTRHPSSFIRHNAEGNNNWLLLIIKTAANFTLAKKTVKIKPVTAVLIAPHTPYHYFNPDGEYMDDWLHFSFPDDAFSLEGMLAGNQFFTVTETDALSFYIRQILWEKTYNCSNYSQDNIDHLMYILLNHLASAFEQPNNSNFYSPYRTRFQEIRITRQNSLYKSDNAEYFANTLGISKSHFQHLYKEFFGVSFQQDYIQMRIAYAQDLLETSDMPIEQIAEICGYTNEVHFYRQFKNSIHMSPAKYRKHFRNQLFL